MKLKEIPITNFQIEEKVDFDVSSLYFHYEEKEIFDLLKQNILSPGMIAKEIKINPKTQKDNYDFSYNCHKEIENCYYNFLYTLINSNSIPEQQYLLDLSMKQADLRFASILISNPKIELTKEQFVELLETENYNMTLKEKLIENVNIKLTEEQLNEGLLNAPYGLDLIYAKRGDSRITEKTIDAIINKSRDSLSSERVLIQLLKNKNLVFNSEQIDYFLTSDNFRLRVECARNHQLIFSDEQVKYSLENNNFDWEDFADDELYSESDLIEAFLENPNIKLTDEIVNTIIFDNSMNHHVESLLNRNDIILNKSQVDRIIAKKDTSTCLMLKKHQLDDNQILKILYTSENWAQILLENYLTRKDIEVSDVIVNVLKISESSDVRKFIENSNDSIKIKKFKA